MRTGFQGSSRGPVAGGKRRTTAEIGCPPVVSPPNTPGTASPHNRVRPLTAGRTRSKHQGTGWCALRSRELPAKTPLLTNQPTKIEKDRVLSNIFYLSTTHAPNNEDHRGTRWNRLGGVARIFSRAETKTRRPQYATRHRSKRLRPPAILSTHSFPRICFRPSATALGSTDLM